MAATRTKDVYLAAQYQGLRPRRGHGRALGAVKHSILCACWHMLTTGELYREAGGGYFSRRDLERDDRPGAGRLTEPRYLSLEELHRLLDAMGDTFRPVAAACAYAGLRASEALGLRWRDIDMKAGTLTVSGQLDAAGDRVPLKTLASVGTVPLLPALAAELRAHRQRVAFQSQGLARVHRDSLVFTTSRGRPQGARNALRAVHEAGEAAGLNGAAASVSACTTSGTRSSRSRSLPVSRCRKPPRSPATRTRVSRRWPTPG